MGYNDRKTDDKRKEGIVREFLEENLYKKFPDYKHNEDAETQKLGVDCEFTGKNYHYVADEKAATRNNYINDGQLYDGEKSPRHRLNTFCLELSMRAKSHGQWERYDGWWLNEKEINNSLVLIWVDRTKSGSIESVEDILEAEVIVVRKEKIDEYLESLGWSKERLKWEVEQLINEFENLEGTFEIGGLRFNIAKWLKKAEAPINILIDRETYRKISDYNHIFKKD